MRAVVVADIGALLDIFIGLRLETQLDVENGAPERNAVIEEVGNIRSALAMIRQIIPVQGEDYFSRTLFGTVEVVSDVVRPRLNPPPDIDGQTSYFREMSELWHSAGGLSSLQNRRPRTTTEGSPRQLSVIAQLLPFRFRFPLFDRVFGRSVDRIFDEMAAGTYSDAVQRLTDSSTTGDLDFSNRVAAVSLRLFFERHALYSAWLSDIGKMEESPNGQQFASLFEELKAGDMTLMKPVVAPPAELGNPGPTTKRLLKLARGVSVTSLSKRLTSGGAMGVLLPRTLRGWLRLPQYQLRRLARNRKRGTK